MEHQSLQGGDPPGAAGLRLPTAESPSSPSCCNTVLLPAQWHGLSRTHNVCELCVNQTGGVQPSPLMRLRCSFVAIKAAVDSFYLKEQTFFHVVSKTVSWCSHFLSFYSPFSSYTACCRTMNRDLLDLARAEGAFLAPHGKSRKEGIPEPLPHIEEQASLSGSALAGLSCRTNKSLNLYLLDSNLFWMYAERLGAAGSLPAKEFAAIVDLQEEVHYVLGQKRALLRASLGTACCCPSLHRLHRRGRGGGRRTAAVSSALPLLSHESFAPLCFIPRGSRAELALLNVPVDLAPLPCRNLHPQLHCPLQPLEEASRG